MTDYVLKERPGEGAVKNLAHYSPLMRQLLSARGIESAEDASAFFAPDYERDVHNPLLLLHMDTAIARIIKALDAGEHIRVFSDFDADGIPAAVLMNDLFKKLTHENFSVKIPHRNTEGFGLNERAVASAIEENVNLLITLDCGTGDATHVEALMNAGIDVIITDHHKEGLTVPSAYAIVNPNQEGDTYPNKGLCGAGVAFKVATALLATLRAKGDARVKDIPIGWEKWLLDMVTLATVADMMPLTGENRTLVHYGLKVLQKLQRLS